MYRSKKSSSVKISSGKSQSEKKLTREKKGFSERMRVTEAREEKTRVKIKAFEKKNK